MPIGKKRAMLVMLVHMLVMQNKQPRLQLTVCCLLFADRHVLLAYDFVSVLHDCRLVFVDVVLLPLQSSCKLSSV